MPELVVKDLTGAQVDTITVSEAIFAAPVNGPLMHQAVVRLLADKRAGTQKAKSRGYALVTLSDPSPAPAMPEMPS